MTEEQDEAPESESDHEPDDHEPDDDDDDDEAEVEPSSTPSPRSSAQTVPMATRWILLGSTAAVSLIIDLWSKQWVWDNLRNQDSWVLIDPYLEFNFAFNTGTAFSIVREIDQPIIFLLVALAVLGYVVYVTLRSTEAGKLSFVALGGIVGGAAGNLHDRFVRVDEIGRHGVVDFIQINYPWGGSWPNFNIADSALVVGVALLLLTSFLERRGAQDEEPAKSTKA